jgi:hypothetical protein
MRNRKNDTASPVIGRSLIKEDTNHGTNDMNHPKSHYTDGSRFKNGIDTNSVPILDDSESCLHIYRNAH